MEPATSSQDIDGAGAFANLDDNLKLRPPETLTPYAAPWHTPTYRALSEQRTAISQYALSPSDYALQKAFKATQAVIAAVFHDAETHGIHPSQFKWRAEPHGAVGPYDLERLEGDIESGDLPRTTLALARDAEYALKCLRLLESPNVQDLRGEEQNAVDNNVSEPSVTREMALGWALNSAQTAYSVLTDIGHNQHKIELRDTTQTVEPTQSLGVDI